MYIEIDIYLVIVDIHLYSQSYSFIILDWFISMNPAMLLFCRCCCVSFRLYCCVITRIYSSSTLFFPPIHHTVCSKIQQQGYRVSVVRFRKLSPLYFFLLNLILYSTQRLSLRKIITNTYNNNIKYYVPSREKFLLDLNLFQFETKSQTDKFFVGFILLNFDHLKLVQYFRIVQLWNQLRSYQLWLKHSVLEML